LLSGWPTIIREEVVGALLYRASATFVAAPATPASGSMVPFAMAPIFLDLNFADALFNVSGQLVSSSSKFLEPTPVSTVVDSTSDFLTTVKVMVILFCASPLEVEILHVVSVTAPSKVIKPRSVSAVAEKEPVTNKVTTEANSVFFNMIKIPFK